MGKILAVSNFKWKMKKVKHLKKHHVLSITVLSILIILVGIYSIFPSKNQTEKKGKVNFIIKHIEEIKNCRSLGWKGANPCLDKIYTHRSDAYTIKELLDNLDSARSTDKLIEYECHGMSHSIGRESFRRTQQIHEAMAMCGDVCGQGCIHGVMEGAFFKDNADGSIKHLTPKQIRDKLNNFCDVVKINKNATREDIYKCYHGLGHALMYVYQELPGSLEACNTLDDGYPRDSCKSGIFMENASGFNTDKNYFQKEGDYLFPCSEMKDIDKPSCYVMHVGNMLRRGLAFEDVPRECNKAGSFARYCFGSLGMEMSYLVKDKQYERPRHVCEDLSGDMGPYCVLHLAGSAISTGQYGRLRMYDFCNSFHLQNARKKCYMIIYDISVNHMGEDEQKVHDECVNTVNDTSYCKFGLEHYERQEQ